MYLYNFETFTTPCELHIEAHTQSEADNAAQTIFFHTKQFEHRYSYFSKTSEIYAINHRETNTLNISDELTGILQMAIFYKRITQGVFDVALSGTLKASLKAPTFEEYTQQRKELLQFASLEHVTLVGNCLSFSNDFTKIDLGGIVKEYAVDQAVLQLQSLGIPSALINYGGDIFAYGSCHDLPWKIGIEDPVSSDMNLIEVELHDQSLCTSGHSKRYTTIEDQNITHIVGASQNIQQYTQVSIIAPTTLDAGIWSTALLINPDLKLPPHLQLIHGLQ